MSNEPRQNSIDATALGNCPVPLADYERVLLGHGSGGKLSADLLKQVFLPALGNDVLDALEDQATLDLFATVEVGSANGNGHRPTLPRLAFTTDSFVVRPLFFPGGNIGQLAVHGTINDLAVGGATPRFLSAAFILEEGFPIDDLQRIAASMRDACRQADVLLVTGDTKVVDRGSGRRPVHHHRRNRPGPSRPPAVDQQRPARATRSSFPAQWAIMASRSCRSARGSNSKPCWKATQRRWAT